MNMKQAEEKCATCDKDFHRVREKAHEEDPKMNGNEVQNKDVEMQREKITRCPKRHELADIDSRGYWFPRLAQNKEPLG